MDQSRPVNLNHTKTMFRFVASILLCSLLPAFGWGVGGHQVVALVAWDQCSPEVRTRVVSLLRTHPRFHEDFEGRMPPLIANGSESDKQKWLFAQASIWPDIARGFDREGMEAFHRAKWHYINEPVFLSEAEKSALEGHLNINLERSLPDGTNDGNKALNIIQAMKLAQNILKSDAPDEKKAVMLCWAFHLGGDAHQPLHSTAIFTTGRFRSGDKGGNAIKLLNQEDDTRAGSLHSVWDDLLGGKQSLNSIKARVADLLGDDELKAVGQAAVQDATQATAVEHWIDESHAIAKEFGYVGRIKIAVSDAEDELDEEMGSVALPTSYFSDAGDVAHRRVVEGGYRLAAVLKDCLAQ
jgi:hypothetical protein